MASQAYLVYAMYSMIIDTSFSKPTTLYRLRGIGGKNIACMGKQASVVVIQKNSL
jgi:hypothetical protein